MEIWGIFDGEKPHLLKYVAPSRYLPRGGLPCILKECLGLTP
jgi:hypothetical protein